ncbi:MAG: DUF167 family protein [Sulfurospirillaceae bacterium]|nr:DUF167 family protein [Sulfurospirillaceae bacterium]
MSDLNSSFYRWDEDVLVLNILGKPSAKKDAIGKPMGDKLKVSVTSAPEDGKATEHMIKFLAKEFGVSKSDIEIVFGQATIQKRFRIKNPKKLPPIIEKP